MRCGADRGIVPQILEEITKVIQLGDKVVDMHRSCDQTHC